MLGTGDTETDQQVFPSGTFQASASHVNFLPAKGKASQVWEPGNPEEEGISFDQGISKGASEEVAFELREGEKSAPRRHSRMNFWGSLGSSANLMTGGTALSEWRLED